MKGVIKKAMMILPMVIIIILLQQELDAKKVTHEEAGTVEQLPDPQVLKYLSLGFEEVIADFYWFKAVLYAGSEVGSMDYDYFLSLIDLVTALDPQFQYPYLFGSIIMSVEADDYEASDRLLMKGFSFHRKSWRFPFGLGYNSYFNHGDPKKAARYLGIASKLPEHPSYLPSLVSRLYHEAGSSDLAIRFLETMIQDTPEGAQRKKLMQRLEALRMIRYLEKIADSYRRDLRKEPEAIDDLVRAGYLRAIPSDPYGGEFYLDKCGRVLSTSKLRPVQNMTRGGES
ncbi:MAG: tetratricopeptide repeat protein [Candidatus Glassbacteria bacterium]